MNFGESLAYWYLRLNGFFPLVNFVLHRDEDYPHDADADLLAVRFPYVSEPIGGQADDWDHVRFDTWAISHRDHTVCVICEVKTGQTDEEAIARAFSEHRCRLAIQRFGVHPPNDVIAIVHDLGRSAVVQRDNATYAKVLISNARRTPQRTACCKMELRDAVSFIEGRMRRYRNQKQAARMFFPGELIQYFAWSSKVPLAMEHDAVE